MKNIKFLGFIFRSVIMGMIAALFLFTFFPQLLSPIQDTEAKITESVTPLSFADSISKVSPSIVNIRTYKADPKKVNTKATAQLGMGSGIIISPQGYIVTNYHVISKVEEIAIELVDGRRTIAKVIGFDAETDLAVLKISMDNLPALTLNSNVEVKVGDITLVIGHPFGVGQSVTMGVVSATGRIALGISEYEDYIQTDAAVNLGNSGGALINSRGDLIGISSVYFTYGTKTGISFAIPISLAMDVIEQIIFNGRVIRGWLGFSGGPLNKAGTDRFGDTAYLINGITSGGPADLAGLREQDIILTVNNLKVSTSSELHKMMAESAIGKKMSIQINRNDEILVLEAIVKERPRPE
ncbi:MAG: serine peptidase DegS [Enterobacterales bacterium]|jgi:serine peptidase DegS